MNPPNHSEWREIKALGADHKIKTPEIFARYLDEGVKRAHSVADGFTSGPWLDTGQITTLHWATYGGIFKCAGEIRAHELEGAKETFSKANLIRSDLKALNAFSREHWFRSEDPLVLAKEMAAYNAAFFKIQPFAFGSEEIGKLILSHQARELFGAKINFQEDQKVYNASIALAVKGHFSPLAAQIIEHSPLRRAAEIYAIDRKMVEAEQQLKERESGMSHSF